MTAQEERVGALLEMANRLVDAGHYSSDTIQDRKDKVVQAREKLKDKSAKKRGELDASKLFQEFRTEVGEMNNFVAEKSKLVREDSFRDGIGNIKAKKHQVLVGEIKTNAGQLKVLNRTGQQMVQRNHFKAKDIGEELAAVNSAWESLVEAVKEQGSKLGQAEAQNDYNRMTADIKTKMADIKNLMKRSCSPSTRLLRLCLLLWCTRMLGMSLLLPTWLRDILMEMPS